MSEFHEWCGNFECGECYDCKCHQIGIMMSTNETLETQLKNSQDEVEEAFKEGLNICDETFNSSYLDAGCGESDTEIIKDFFWKNYLVTRDKQASETKGEG